MRNSIIPSLATLLLMGMSSVAFAQDSTEGEGETTADKTFPVSEAQVVPYVKETHGAWDVRCVKAPEADEQCNLQLLLKNEDGTAVAEMNMQALPAGGEAASGVTFVTPLGTLLTIPMTFQIEQGLINRYPFNWCEAAGCVLRFGLTQGQIDQMKSGTSASVQLVSIVSPNEPIQLTIPLEGFSAAWTAVGGQ